MAYEKELEVAKNIAKQAGVIMLQYFDGDQEVETKSDNSPVTIADKKINTLVISELKKHFDDLVIGEEESTGEYGMGRRWFCDPIDGTIAFVSGVPTAMFSLALIEDGRPVLGVAYDPFLDRLYEAVKGGGGHCNGKQIHVSTETIDGSVIAISAGTTKTRYPHIEYLLDRKRKLRPLANGAVFKSCLVARGKISAYIEPGVNGHDTAAIDLIVTESGGIVTGLNGKILDYSKPFKGVAVSNGIIHNDLIESLVEEAEAMAK